MTGKQQTCTQIIYEYGSTRGACAKISPGTTAPSVWKAHPPNALVRRQVIEQLREVTSLPCFGHEYRSFITIQLPSMRE